MDAKVLKPAVEDFNFFDKAYLLVHEVLTKLSWVFFCQYKDTYNAPLIQVFYSSLATTNKFAI
ncbi:hypothetical protein Scep_004374 [Stephania cephalantha]|uniref:Uncharacterized protein n=1 Tax=Stephania cephalantha TaxID=152367 RepID=A0AAP0KUV9_9MAGN